VPSPLELTQLARQAAVVLSKRLNQAVTLVEPQLIKDKTRSVIVRCAVKSAASITSIPASVIIKQIRDNVALGFSDWASLAFLATVPAAHGLVPHFLGGDVAARFFIMADLGGLQNLEDILRGNDAPLALATLRSLAVQMAKLHATTLATEPAFEAVRNTLPGANGLGRQAEAKRWLQNQPKIVDWFQAVDCALPMDFKPCLQRIADYYAQPGSFLCFTHGDPAPSNNHIANGQVRLVDFEYGGFRHALYDISGWNILCPLPLHSVQMMCHHFQQALAIACPAARDQSQYNQGWAMMCAFRALAILTWIAPDVLHTNRPWVDEHWTGRHALVAAMTRLAEATNNVAELEPVYVAANRLTQALRQRWGEFENATDIATQWPAFAS
jgi:hypothetical protein